MSVSAKARSTPPLRSIPGPQQPDAEWTASVCGSPTVVIRRVLNAGGAF